MFVLTIEYATVGFQDIGIDVDSDKSAILLATDILSSESTYRGAELFDGDGRVVECWFPKLRRA